MFDIGFPELLVVSIIALVVIGPDKLPETIGSIMLWIGRVRNSFSSIKQELEQELGADKIRQQLHNESVMHSLKKTRNQVSEVIASAESAMKSNASTKPPPSIDTHNIDTHNIDTHNIDTHNIDTHNIDTQQEPAADEPRSAA